MAHPFSKIGFSVLPDPDAIFRRQIKRVIWTHIKRFVPLVEVADDAIDSVLRRAVWTTNQLLAQGLFTILVPPDLRPGHEEALIAS